jgi:dihydroorotase
MILIQNAVIAGLGSEKQDILIDAGKIQKIGKSLDTSGCSEIIEADGLIALAGIVDLNVRIQDDILNIKNLDTLYKATQKAGVTYFALSPRFEPLIENQTFKALLAGRLEQNYPNMQLAVKALIDKELTKLNNISTLIKNGIKIVQENSDINGNLLRRIYEYSKMHRNLFFVFCENKILNDSGVMNEGEVSFKLGLPGVSKIGEISEVAKVSQMSMHYDVPTLFQALSTKRAIDILAHNKKTYPHLYSEVSIHHLCLDESNCDDFNTYAKLNPPLRTLEDTKALQERLKDGKIDILTALHSPKSVIYKDVAFSEAKYGIDIIEDYLSICYTYLVKEGVVSWDELTKLLSQKPAEILGEDSIGQIKEGFDADIVLFDPKVSKEVTKKSSPYIGKTLHGAIIKVFSRGSAVIS